ncbi:HNH endonuclease [Halomonas getboli]|uniref:HNH endonuclease n=1 Tax=Halomonas getboli TaxID=2935862 RepID=UPI00200036D5|nr:HNH endonuclease signature motif containing protein [Halomonas getboli]MCK2183518.1 HNH endonuclease [Halomonas getboli]
MDTRPWRHLYNTRRWHRLRAAQLRDEPLCRFCRDLGRVTPAKVADHITPHKGGEALFFDADNLQSLCKTCHDSAKQRQEKTGSLPGCDLDGLPLDPDHPWRA